MAVLDLDRVCFRRDDGPAVVDLSLTVEAAEVVSIVGPRGAGKGALATAISGVTAIERGTMTLLGYDITHRSPGEREIAGLGRTVDSTGLFSAMTIGEHIAEAFQTRSRSGGPGRRFGRRSNHRETAEVIDVMGLGDDIGRQVGTLPLLARRRLELTLALARKPAIVVADGLLAGLTQAEALVVARLCRAARDLCGVAVLICHHHPDALFEISKYAYVIDAGRVVAGGDPVRLAARADVASVFHRPPQLLLG